MKHPGRHSSQTLDWYYGARLCEDSGRQWSSHILRVFVDLWPNGSAGMPKVLKFP
jgi:hypothetical protein